MGNDCYMLSVMQALLHLPMFINAVASHLGCSQGGCLLCDFRALSSEYWPRISQEAGIDWHLSYLRSELQSTEPFFEWLGTWEDQQDAEDFLSRFLNALMGSNLRRVAAFALLILVSALTSASARPTLRGLFQHEIIRTSKCPDCGQSFSVKETNNDLQVRFEGDATLAQILQDTTFGANLITGRRCTPCGKTADIMQTIRLGTSPDVLILQLVRFNANGSKNMARIAFPEHLDLTGFTAGQQHGNGNDTEREEGNVEEISTHYRLASVVHHQGTLNGGHYICVAKNPAGLWNKINDNDVKENAGIDAALDPEDDFSPYLLFYIRSTPGMVRELE